MKKLSDYKGDEAIELWADLLDPISAILNDKRIQRAVRTGKPKMTIAKEILKGHANEATQILQRIDPEPVDGINIILRLMAVMSDIGQNEEIKSFFGYAEQAQTESEFSGSVTENIEASEN
jgi:methanogenic corrinoid protein MtbC1